MAIIQPHLPDIKLVSSGVLRERDILQKLQEGLPNSFNAYHSVHWSGMHEGTQRFGEIDIIVLSPQGNLVLLEVKAGNVNFSEEGITKHYSGDQFNSKNITHQVHAQVRAMRQALRNSQLDEVRFAHLLVLPDQKITQGSIAFPRERIVDATQQEQLCQLIISSVPTNELSSQVRERVSQFLENRFELIPDVSMHISQIQSINSRLSEGLSTWVPRINHQNDNYVIKGTAGSGKTQLAITLMRQAALKKQYSSYICYNRPLADHIRKIAPSNADVASFHQLCIDYWRTTKDEPDFTDKQIFIKAEEKYIKDSPNFKSNLDLIIIDESQDFETEWIQAIINRLKPDGKLYVMGDPDQLLYDRPLFDLNDAVSITCNDNFRSPQKIVEIINLLQLVSTPIKARSSFKGEIPEFRHYNPTIPGNENAIIQCVNDLLIQGYKLNQIALISFHGKEKSHLLSKDNIGKWQLKKATGIFDKNENALWTNGELFVETISRFKGQSAPVVVLCEVDFEELKGRELRKLFVGLTRAQYKVVCLITEQAENMLMRRCL
jgi:hypothetical protein